MPDYIMTVNVLGAEYHIVEKPYADDVEFFEKGRGGYCSVYERTIVICDIDTHPDFQRESETVKRTLTNETIRHEIVHAFLHESGLFANAHTSDDAWALNEEMVDWIAIQGPKICKAWKEAGTLGGDGDA